MIDTIENICRLCLESGILIPIFDTESLSYRIMSCTTVQIYEHDGLPNLMCTVCLSQLESVISFREKVEKSDACLREFLNGPVNENTKPPKVPNGFHDFKLNDIKDDNIDTTTAQYCEKNLGIQNNPRNIKIRNHSSIQVKNVKQEGLPKKRGRKRLPIGANNVDDNNLNKSVVLSANEDCIREKRVRDNTRKHMCDTCGKTFLYLSNLVDHCRIHTGDKPFICTVCGHRFSQTGHLMIHARTHTGIKPYKCNVCCRAFTVSHALKKHLRTHTGERPYPCSVCNKSFVTSYHLTNHFKRHTGEKNFKCDWSGCNLSFVNVSEMKRHRVRHEKIVNNCKNKNVIETIDYEPNVVAPSQYLNEVQMSQYTAKVSENNHNCERIVE